jgi:hypothetical protein
LLYFDTWPCLDLYIERNNKRGPKGKKDKAGPTLTKIEKIHQTNDLFYYFYTEIATSSTASES